MFRHVRTRCPTSSRSSGQDGFRTDSWTAAWKGIILPAPLLIWGLMDFFGGSVSWGRGGRVSHDWWIVHGMVLVKICLAASIFTWNFLANSPKFDQWIGWLLLAEIVLAAAGLIMIVAGALA